MKEQGAQHNASVDRREFFKRIAVDSTLAAGFIAAGFALKSRGIPILEIHEKKGSSLDLSFDQGAVLFCGMMDIVRSIHNLVDDIVSC